MASAFMPFRCGTSGNQTNLCLYGSTCESQMSIDNRTTVQTCECPPGYIHDFTWSHFPNCGLPDYALPVMFGVITTLTLYSVSVTGFILRESRSKAKTIIAIWLTNTIITWAFLMTVMIEQGFYEVAAVLYCINMVLINRGTVLTTIALATPIFAMFKSSVVKLKRALYALELVSAVAQVTLIGFLIHHARDVDDVSSFNSMMVLNQFLVAIFTIGLTIILNLNGVRLLYQIENSNVGNKDDPKMAEFVGRLKSMIVKNTYGLFFCTTLFVFPAVTLALGSFPGQYIFWFLTNVSTPLFCAQTAMNFRTDQNLGLAGVSSSERNNNTGSRLSKQDVVVPSEGPEYSSAKAAAIAEMSTAS